MILNEDNAKKSFLSQPNNLKIRTNINNINIINSNPYKSCDSIKLFSSLFLWSRFVELAQNHHVSFCFESETL